MVNQENCQLFIILPEHEDVEKTSSCMRDFSVLSLDEAIKYVQLIDTMEQRGQAEHYRLYYDSKNINAFLKPIQELAECYPSVEITLRNSLHRFAEDWREEIHQDCSIEYKLYHTIVVDDTFCEACERKYQSKIYSNDSTFAIINHNAINRPPAIAAMTRNAETVEIPIIKGDIHCIELWLQTNRRPLRIYNWNPKHGENGKGAHRSHKNDMVALLYCSKERAAELLKQAIGADANSGPLYAWDEKCQRYMEFKRDSDYTVSFHSYHLENNDRKIPSIKKLLGR